MSRSHLVARNVIVTLVTQLFMWGLTFGVTLYLPRYLKDTGLGTMTLVGSYAMIFSVFVSLGTSTALIKEIARDRTRTGELVSTALLMRLGLGLVAIAAGWLGTRLLGYSASLQFFAVIALVVMIVSQLGDVLSSALAGLEEFPRQNASLLVERALTSCLLIGLVIFHRPLWMFIGGSLLGSAVSICVSIYMLRERIAGAPRIRWSTVQSLARAGVPFLMVGIFGATYGYSDALLLSKFSGVAAIGWYSLAKRLGGTTMVIPVALTSTMLPTLTRMFHEDRAAFGRASQRLLNMMTICVTPFAAVLILAPGKILTLLHYPASYRNSIPVLMFMGSAVILWYLSQAVGTILIASEKQAVFSKITGIAALVSIPLCTTCILITQRLMTNGAIGAMISDALLELFMVIAYIRVLPGGIFEWRGVALLGRTTVAALPFAFSLYAMGGPHDLFWPLMGLLLYPFLCGLLRCFCRDDLQMLRQVTRKFSRA